MIMIKKISAFLLCLVISACFCVPAFADDEALSQPKVMVTDYGTDATVYPGTVFNLKVTIKNQSKTTDVKNIKVTVADASGSILPVKIDYVYLPSLAKGASYLCVVKMKASEDFPGGYCNLQVEIEYEDGSGQSYSSSDSLTISVEKKKKAADDPSQPLLMVTDYSTKGTLKQGNSITLSVTVTNKSKTKDVSNVKISFTDPSGSLVPTGVSAGYLSAIFAGGSRVWNIPLKVNTDCEGGPCTASVSMEYETKDGEKLSSSDNVSITIPKKNPSGDASQPRLMVTGYEIDNGYISPDEEGSLSISIKNTSTSKSVSNIKLSLADETGEIRPEGTGTKFVTSIGAGATYTWTLKVKAAHIAATGEHPVTVGIEYEDADKTPYTASDRITLPVRQNAVLSYSGAQLPVKVTQGDTATVTVSLMNTGKSTLSNCIVEMDVSKLETGGSVLAGEIKPGETKTASVNFRVDSEYTGKADGTLTIKYEDDFGQKYEEVVNLSTVIQEKIEITSMEKKEEKKNPLWWLFAVIGIVVGGGIGAGVPIAIYSSRQRKKDEEML